MKYVAELVEQEIEHCEYVDETFARRYKVALMARAEHARAEAAIALVKDALKEFGDASEYAMEYVAEHVNESGSIREHFDAKSTEFTERLAALEGEE